MTDATSSYRTSSEQHSRTAAEAAKLNSATQLELFPVYAVTCFTCPHTVRETSPETAHAVMEQHYADKHARQIAALVGDLTPTKPGARQ